MPQGEAQDTISDVVCKEQSLQTYCPCVFPFFLVVEVLGRREKSDNLRLGASVLPLKRSE